MNPDNRSSIFVVVAMLLWTSVVNAESLATLVERTCVLPRDTTSVSAYLELEGAEAASKCQNNGDKEACRLAEKIYGDRARQCDAYAMWFLADLAESGDLEVVMPSSEIAKLQLFAASGGVPKAQLWRGLHYYSGDHDARDPVAAFAWFEKAALNGEVVAQAAVAKMLYIGEGVDRDTKEALTWACIVVSNGSRNLLDRSPYGFLEPGVAPSDLDPKASKRARALLKAHPKAAPAPGLKISC